MARPGRPALDSRDQDDRKGKHKKMAKRWYVVHAYSGFEHQVERTLKERIARAGMQEKFGVLSKGSISLLLVDHGDIYWGGGSLQQFVIGGDSNTNVVTGLQGISAVAVNSTDIFVADGKLLRRVARP